MKAFVILFIFFFIKSGIGTTITKPRIAGGTIAFLKEFKYQAGLIANDTFICGAVVISYYHLLSAAHCVVHLVLDSSFSNILIYVVLGSNQLYEGDRYPIKRISYHKDFARHVGEYYNDNIAVLHTGYAIRMTIFVKRVRLPPENLNIPPESLIIVSGFGYYSREQQYSQRLRQIAINVVRTNICETNLEDLKLTDNHFCAMTGFPLGTCSGDDGGPVVDKTKSILLGILSYNPQICHDGFPVIATRVSQYLSYITSEINYRRKDRATWTEHPSANYR